MTMTLLKPITDIAHQLKLDRYLIPYGHTMAKISLDCLKSTLPKGKLVLVSSITPTPLGEGKTVTTIGLSQGLNYIGKLAVACIRQPSLGPVFGAKGGAAGGGKAQVLPMEKLNLHLTGDIHAITAAHNLASAALDARLYHEQQLGDEFTAKTGLKRLNINPEKILWPRVVDHNDRALRDIKIACSGNLKTIGRHDRFEITAASELMAILALTESISDMRQRIGRIILAHDINAQPITTEDLEVAGAMAVLMKDAIQPTLMQTSENTPVLIHAGPFANIAHGNSSVLADRIGLQQADFVVTEAGFGSDMGMEKFFNIKHRQSGISPSCIVLVVTVRSLKANSGKFDIKPGQPLPEEITNIDLDLLATSCSNLGWHIDNAKRYGLPVIVAINRFPTDDDKEINLLQQYALSQGAFASEVSTTFIDGGSGAAKLAKQVIKACQLESTIKLLYTDETPLMDKIQLLVQKGYGADRAEFTEDAMQQLLELEQTGYSHLPLCMVKTALSISADATLKNVPTNFTIGIYALKVSAGAGFIRIYAGNIMTMPGLGSLPAYRHIDLDENGNIIGLN